GCHRGLWGLRQAERNSSSSSSSSSSGGVCLSVSPCDVLNAPPGLPQPPPPPPPLSPFALWTLDVCASLNPVGTLLRTLRVWPPRATMRRSSTDETPYRRSPSLDSKAGTPPFTSGFHRYSGEFEYKRPPFAFGFHTAKGPGGSPGGGGGRYGQGKKYVVFYLDLSFIFLLELRRCRMAEGCMMGLRYGMVFFNLLF
ncbi:hypothetical protein CRUP_000433, partial [Coryphaenoides rupestris]